MPNCCHNLTFQSSSYLNKGTYISRFEKRKTACTSQVITTIKDTSYIANIATAELMGRTFQLIQISPNYTGLTTQNVSDVFVLCGLACVIYFTINFTLSCVVRHMQKPKKRAVVVSAD